MASFKTANATLSLYTDALNMVSHAYVHDNSASFLAWSPQSVPVERGPRPSGNQTHHSDWSAMFLGFPLAALSVAGTKFVHGPQARFAGSKIQHSPSQHLTIHTA